MKTPINNKTIPRVSVFLKDVFSLKLYPNKNKKIGAAIEQTMRSKVRIELVSI